MSDKILVPLHIGYGKAVEGLGEITSNVDDFLENPNEFKLILFTGGEDVSPHLYGDMSPRYLCRNSVKRDMYEMVIFRTARANNIKMTGICRGTQFITVMSGGRMMHHINGHAGGYHMVETSRGDEIMTNSTHHQMIIPPDDGYTIAWTKERHSRFYYGYNDNEEFWPGPETEAVLLPRTLCCGVQWHPETMDIDHNGYHFYFKMISNFLDMDIGTFINEYTGKKSKVVNAK